MLEHLPLTSDGVRFEWRDLDQLQPPDIDRWRALGLAACSPNIYLMPEFLLPAARHLDPGPDPRLAILWQGEQMVALGAFVLEPPSLRFPFPRLTAFQSRHSFQSGLLLRRGVHAAAASRFLQGLLGSGCRGIRFAELRADTPAFSTLLGVADEHDARWFVDSSYYRATLNVGAPEAWQSHVSKSRHKRMRYQLRRLARVGRLSFRVLVGSEVTDGVVDDFMRLEDAGWKTSSSLRSQPASERFFRELCDGAQQNLVFCELLLDDSVIASTANFTIGACGFAFKTGHDPDYASFSPGLLVEYETLRCIDSWPRSVKEIEGGSQQGAFIDDFWPGRIPMVSGHLVVGPAAAAFASVKYGWKKLRGRSQPGAEAGEPVDRPP